MASITSAIKAPGWAGATEEWRSVAVMRSPSMVVLVIDVERGGAVLIPGEGQAPIAGDAHRVAALPITRKRVEMPAGHVHVIRGGRLIQRGQTEVQPLENGRLAGHEHHP